MQPNFVIEMHRAAVACVKALANLSGRSIHPNERIDDVLAELRNAVAMIPSCQEDPYAEPTVVELSGVYANSWHRAACELAQTRAKMSSEESTRLGQCQILPVLQPDHGWLLAQLEAERLRALGGVTSSTSPETRQGSAADLLARLEMSGSPENSVKPGRDLIAVNPNATAVQLVAALESAGIGKGTVDKAKSLFGDLFRPITLNELARRLTNLVIEPGSSSPFRRYFSKFIESIPEWEFIKYACAELFGGTDMNDLCIAGQKWAGEIERLVSKLRFEGKVANAGDMLLADVNPHIEGLLGTIATPPNAKARPADQQRRKGAKSSNPLHDLIATLGRFFDAVWTCHHASTEELRKQSVAAWTTEKSWFWPRFRFPHEAIRGLADPALAWCSKKGLPMETYVDTVEVAAHFITELAKLTVPCSMPDIYANKDEALKIWERQGEFLLNAIPARDALRKLAALTGEAWQPDKEGQKDRLDLDQKETAYGEGIATNSLSMLTNPQQQLSDDQAIAKARDWLYARFFERSKERDVVTVYDCVNGGERKPTDDEEYYAVVKATEFHDYLQQIGAPVQATVEAFEREGWLRIVEGFPPPMPVKLGRGIKLYHVLSTITNPLQSPVGESQKQQPPPLATPPLSDLDAAEAFLTSLDEWFDLCKEWDGMTPRYLADYEPSPSQPDDAGGEAWHAMRKPAAERARQILSEIAAHGPAVVRFVADRGEDSRLVHAWIRAQGSKHRDGWTKSKWEDVRLTVDHAVTLATAYPNERPPVGEFFLPIASDVPDLGSADTISDLWEWCNRNRETLRLLKIHMGDPPPAMVAAGEFRVIPEIVHQCRKYLLGFGIKPEVIPEQFGFPALPLCQTPTGPEHFPSGMEAFLSWASCYRAPQHGIFKLISEVESFLTLAMQWCKDAEAKKQNDACETDDTPKVNFEFTRRSGMFQIRGFGEDGLFSADLIGFQQIAMLLKKSGEGVPMVQLVACGENNDARVAADRKRTAQPVFDDQALQDMGKALKKMVDDRTHAEENELAEEYANLTNQIHELTKQIESAMTKTGKAKDLNSVWNKLRPRILGTLKTAYKKLREADPSLPKLSEHFENSISSQGSHFVYRPPSSLVVEWKL